MTTFARPTEIAAPALEALPGTLLETATVLEGGVEWRGGTNKALGLFESYNCIATDNAAEFPCTHTFLTIPTMTTSSTATTGGTLAAGTYKAVLTALNDRGQTSKSNELSQVTTGATSTITWNWTDVSGETSYNLWVTTVDGSSGSETFLINLPAGTTSYVWTGTPAPDGVTTPPAANTAVVTVTKTFTNPAWQDGFLFPVYAGVVCKLGDDLATQERKLTDAFLASESQAVARALMQTRFVAGTGGASWSAPTDLTPGGGAVNADIGLAALEGNASTIYGGVPTLHMGKTVASLLTRNGQLVKIGNKFFTALGTPVAVDGGYESPNNGPAGTNPSAGEQWVYVSGSVIINRGSVIARSEMNRSTNEATTLVERLYMASVDCYAAAIRVKTTV